MAVTPNAVVGPQAISTFVHQIATGDQTAAADLDGATTNGRLIYKVFVYPASSNREITLYYHNGTNARKICLVDIISDVAADITATDLLANVPLPYDANGNKVLYLAPTHKLQISAENVAVTSDVIVFCHEL